MLSARQLGIVLLAAIATAALTVESSLAEEGQRLFQVRLAQREAAEGLEKVVVGGRTLYLHPKIELTNADVDEANVGRSERGDAAIDLVMTDAGAMKLGEITANRLFQPLAFLIDGKVICAPLVASKLTRRLQIVGDFSEAEAERIADGIVGRQAP